MTAKKFFVMLMAGVMLLASVSFAFAESGAGYFGDGYAPEVIDNPDPVNGNTVEYEPEDDPVEPEEPEEPETPTPMPTPTTKPAEKTNLENKSEDPKKVITSYGLDSGTTTALINKHRDAAKGKGNRELSERYINLSNQYPQDYLAPYKAAVANYDMTRYSTAQKWCRVALERNPNYVPARQLMRKIEGALKR